MATLTQAATSSSARVTSLSYGAGYTTITDATNQVTRLEFTHAARNRPLAADLFIFTPPAGVDVIGRAPGEP